VPLGVYATTNSHEMEGRRTGKNKEINGNVLCSLNVETDLCVFTVKYLWKNSDSNNCSTHILCDCEAIAHLRFRHLGHFFMEPSDFYDAPVFKVLHFILNVGLMKG
jgi:hypothetical protein